MENIIQYDFYNSDQAKLIAWFIGSFNFYSIFRILVGKNYKFDKAKKEFNEFKSDSDIDNYVQSSKHYSKTIITCLKNNFQNLAM